jgi:hypothetical protein
MLAKFKEKLADKRKQIIQVLKVPDTVQEIRMSICRQCDQLFKPLNTCKRCGCYMPAKTYLASVKCPLNKWGRMGE